MDDNVAGKIMAAGVILLILWGITAFLTARGEVARRARLVVGGAIALAVTAIWFSIAGPLGLAAALVVVGLLIWIFSGLRK